MFIIHSVQKLLNTSRLKPAMFITQPYEGQQLHNWYARLLATGFPGKLFVIYVHEPSLMTIVCKGKTIQGTWEQFVKRLGSLLRKFKFSNSFITSESDRADGYVVSKTQSKSILSHMNQMVFHLEFNCRRFNNYEAISLDLLEEGMMGYLYQYGVKVNEYRTPLDYWKGKVVFN